LNYYNNYRVELEKEEKLQTLTEKSLYNPTCMKNLIHNTDINQGVLELYVEAICNSLENHQILPGNQILLHGIRNPCKCRY
jgi:hypothetical protein